MALSCAGYRSTWGGVMECIQIGESEITLADQDCAPCRWGEQFIIIIFINKYIYIAQIKQNCHKYALALVTA